MLQSQIDLLPWGRRFDFSVLHIEGMRGILPATVSKEVHHNELTSCEFCITTTQVSLSLFLTLRTPSQEEGVTLWS